MQAIDSSRVFELAQHFDAAGEPARALPYALAAAQQAKASGDVDVAERYYRIADRCSAGAPPEVRRELAEALGDVLTVRGLYAEAAVQLERARALIVGRAARARLALRVGDLCYRQGDFHGAGEALERGLAILGRPVWRARLPLLAGIGWQVLRLAARTLLPAPGPRRAITNTEEDLLACNMYSRLSLTAILARGALWSVWAHLQELNLAERHPDTPEQARAWSLHALAMAQLPWFGRAIDFAERAVQLCRKLGDSWHLGLALQRQAFVLSWSSRFDEALLKGREALTLLERAGDRWEAEAAMFCLASTLLRTGRLREAVELSRELRQSGLSSGNALASTYPLEVWARATFGKVPASDVASELDRRRDQPHLRPALAVADGVRLLYAGRVPEAVQALEEGEAQVRRSGLRSELVAPVRMWLATARRMLAMQDNPLDAQGREQRLAAAVRASRDALALARRFPNNAAHALRESGLCAALAGDGARARALFDESIATAERLGQRHERALTLEACADVGDALGWPGAAADRAQSRLERAALELPSADAISEPPTHTLSLIERFQTLLIEGRRIASALSHDAVFQATRAAAQSLLRAEPCAVLTLSPTGAVVVPSPLFPATELLAARAIAAGHPVIVALDDDPRGPGAPDAPKRSIIAAPIAIRGEVVALLCAAHPQLGATFGLDDERLAAFVTALAGAALENADGFARLQSAEHALRESDRQIRGLAEGAAREQEEERKRLALALHDGAGQALVAATLQLEDLRRRPEGLPLAPAIERVEALLRSLLEDLRAMSHDLRPAVLDHFGLQAALQKLADASSTTSLRVSLQLQHDDLPELRGDGALGLYRIAQAALANVARHAQATHAEMSLEITPAEVVLEIADDGLGFDPEARRASSGIGLLGIRERTAWLRGRFELTTAPGEGTS
ncbi:MAG: GAF domain-containing protein, partial [Deltaproteobacteria bacterium]|nr:GAF domain-containing protein [Deltaproteobacteria bacterium]